MGYKKNLTALLIGGLMIGTSATSAFASAREDEKADRDHPQASASAEESQKDGPELPAAAAADSDAHLAPLQEKLQKNGITLAMAENAIQNAERVWKDYAPEIDLLKHNKLQDFYDTGKPNPIKTGLLTHNDYGILSTLAYLGHLRARELHREISPMMNTFGRIDRIIAYYGD